MQITCNNPGGIIMKRTIAALLVAAVAVFSAPAEVNAQANEKLKVMTSFNPITEIVKTIGGDKVETTQIVEPGLEPHDFEPTPKDLAELSEAKILFINGLGMEPWAEKAEGAKIIDLSEGVDKIATKDEEHIGEDEDHAHDHEGSSNISNTDDDHDHEGHSHGEFDPHIWLGLDELEIMAENAYKGLSEADAANEAYYKENLDKFISEVKALEDEFNPKFEAMKVRSFVTGHEAFGYLCRNAGLTQKAVVGVFGEGEATPQQLAELAEFVKKENITTIFVEKGMAPELSKTLAKETGAKAVEIGTLETEGELLPTIRDIYTKIIESAS